LDTEQKRFEYFNEETKAWDELKFTYANLVKAYNLRTAKGRKLFSADVTGNGNSITITELSKAKA